MNDNKGKNYTDLTDKQTPQIPDYDPANDDQVEFVDTQDKEYSSTSSNQAPRYFSDIYYGLDDDDL